MKLDKIAKMRIIETQRFFILSPLSGRITRMIFGTIWYPLMIILGPALQIIGLVIAIYVIYLIVKFLRLKIKEMEDDKHEKPRY